MEPKERSKQRPIVVAGSGRSGTTWIGDTLAACEGCCPIFEPLHGQRVPQVPAWGRLSTLPGPYLPASQEQPQWHNFFQALFAGRISNYWTRQEWQEVPAWAKRLAPARRIGQWLSRRRYQARQRAAERYVVKEIRGNLLLDWLSQRFDIQVLFLTRHPCAVVGSRLRLLKDDPGWAMHADEILGDTQLMTDYLMPYRDLIASADTPVRQQAILWCVENLVPLAQAPRQPWMICAYEDFTRDPENLFDRVMGRFQLQRTPEANQAAATLVSNASGAVSLDKPWHHPLSRSDGEEVLAICRQFDLTVYGREALPCHDRLQAPSKILAAG